MRIVNDRRRLPRVAWSGEAVIQSRKAEVHCTGIDVSGVGIALFADRVGKPRRRVRVHARLGSFPVLSQAVVVRVTRTSTGYRWALRFHKLDAQTQANLEAFVRGERERAARVVQAQLYAERMGVALAACGDPSDERTPEPFIDVSDLLDPGNSMEDTVPWARTADLDPAERLDDVTRPSSRPASPASFEAQLDAPVPRRFAGCAPRSTGELPPVAEGLYGSWPSAARSAHPETRSGARAYGLLAPFAGPDATEQDCKTAQTVLDERSASTDVAQTPLRSMLGASTGLPAWGGDELPTIVSVGSAERSRTGDADAPPRRHAEVEADEMRVWALEALESGVEPTVVARTFPPRPVGAHSEGCGASAGGPTDLPEEDGFTGPVGQFGPENASPGLRPAVADAEATVVVSPVETSSSMSSASPVSAEPSEPARVRETGGRVRRTELSSRRSIVEDALAQLKRRTAEKRTPRARGAARRAAIGAPASPPPSPAATRPRPPEPEPETTTPEVSAHVRLAELYRAAMFDLDLDLTLERIP